MIWKHTKRITFFSNKVNVYLTLLNRYIESLMEEKNIEYQDDIYELLTISNYIYFLQDYTVNAITLLPLLNDQNIAYLKRYYQSLHKLIFQLSRYKVTTKLLLPESKQYIDEAKILVISLNTYFEEIGLWNKI